MRRWSERQRSVGPRSNETEGLRREPLVDIEVAPHPRSLSQAHSSPLSPAGAGWWAMSGERELVTDFASLRAGDFIEVHCDHPGCGKTHRGLLLSQTTNARIDPDGKRRERVSGWPLVADCTSTVTTSQTFSVTPTTVARRIVFRIDTGLSASSQETAKRRTPARTR